MARLYTTDENGQPTALLGTPQTASDLPYSAGVSTAQAIDAKQDAIKYSDFTGTTDTAGNIALQDVDTNNIILSVWATNTYPTNPVASGGTWYVRCIKNPADADVSKSVHIYFAYI